MQLTLQSGNGFPRLVLTHQKTFVSSCLVTGCRLDILTPARHSGQRQRELHRLWDDGIP
jgi:hypothetical protein